MKLMSDI